MGRFDQDEANDKVASAQGDLVQAQTALAAKSKELSDEEAKYTDLLKDADNAAQGLAANNVESNAEYAENQLRVLVKKRDDGTATDDDLSKINDLKDSVPLLRQKENELGKSFGQTIARLMTDLDAANATAAAHPDEAVGERASAHAEDIKDQLRAISYYQNATSALAKGTETNSKDQLDGRVAVTELQGKVDALTVMVQAAQAKAATVGVVDATQLAKQQQSDADAETKHAFEVRQAQREAQRKLLLDQSQDPTLSADQRAANKVKADQLAAQGDRDKLANANALGLTDADRIAVGGDIKGQQQKAANVNAIQKQKDVLAAETAQDRADREALEALKQQETQLKQQASQRGKDGHLQQIVAVVERLGEIHFQAMQAQAAVNADLLRRAQKAQDTAQRGNDLIRAGHVNAL